MAETPNPPRSNARVVGWCLAGVLGMFAFGFAMVPLYDVFCDITGINGKTGGRYEASAADTRDDSRTVEVQFLAQNGPDMPWVFRPVTRSIEVHPGEPVQVVFYAENPTGQAMVAQAVPSLAPAEGTLYFHKTECFCFNQQILQAGENVEMPLVFIVDSALPEHIHKLTLSYTLYDQSAMQELSRIESVTTTKATTAKPSEAGMATDQTYYVPEQSKWPIIATVGLGTTLFGVASIMVNGSKGDPTGGSWTLFMIGSLIMAYMLFGWFGNVIRESRAGLYSPQMDRSFRWGMSWFIFSEVMFFAAFFGALFYARVFAVPWLGGEGDRGSSNMLWEGFQATWPLINNPDPQAYPPAKEVIGPWGLPLVNTILLVTSSFTVTVAHHGLKQNNRTKIKLWLGLTILLALGFLALQAEEYIHAYTELDLTLQSGIYGSTFFMLTGFHGAHVMLGTLMLSIMLIRIFKGHFTAEKHFGFEAASWYWHFVDVVWLGLFVFVYIL